MHSRRDNSPYYLSQQVIRPGEKLYVATQSHSYKAVLSFGLIIIASILLSVLLCQWTLWAYHPIDRGLTGCLLTIVCFLTFDIFSAWLFFSKRKAYIAYRFNVRMFFAAVSTLIAILLSYMLWAASNSISSILLPYVAVLCANLILHMLLSRYRPAHERPRAE